MTAAPPDQTGGAREAPLSPPADLVVFLEGWLLPDGSYPDVTVGDSIGVGLEFEAERVLDVVTTPLPPGLRYTGVDVVHEVTARVVHLVHAVVLDRLSRLTGLPTLTSR